MFEKWWGEGLGAGLNCLLARETSCRAIKKPRTVITRAVTFRYMGMVIVWVLKRFVLEVIRSPETTLPKASRLRGFIK